MPAVKPVTLKAFVKPPVVTLALSEVTAAAPPFPVPFTTSDDVGAAAPSARTT